MMQFYDISHNTSYTPGVPEIEEIIKGIEDKGPCPVCGVSRRYPVGDPRVRLGKTRARFWPDAIACGDYPLFVVSERFVDAMRSCGIRLELGGTVRFVEPNRSGLSLDEAPQYYWIDGTRHFAATMDFEESGYVNVQFCSVCGARSEDIGRTYERQHADPPPGIVFDYDASSKLDLFTTDLAPTAFFCTEKVFDCARQHRLTNLYFSPVEKGAMGKPMKY